MMDFVIDHATVRDFCSIKKKSAFRGCKSQKTPAIGRSGVNRLFEFVFIILSPKDNNLLVAISATLAFVRIMVNFNKLDIKSPLISYHNKAVREKP